MGQFEQHEACPECGSSDALGRYEDGTAYCFSCEGYQPAPKDDGPEPIPMRARGHDSQLIAGEVKALPLRSIDEKTCQKFDYTCGHDKNGVAVQIAGYYDDVGRLVAQKIRYPDKKFTWVGDPKAAGLYGQHLWNGGRRLVVTEGEIDALSMAQAWSLKWPVVSIPNGAQGARKDLKRHIEFLELFDTVVFMFDDDEPGRDAAKECAELLTPGKAAIAHLPLKDANEMLKEGRIKDLVSASWEAKPYRPDGIVLGNSLWSLVSTEPEMGLEYPWPILNLKTYGQRKREIVTWAGGTGIGKSSLVREVAYNLVRAHGKKVGIIALEESVKQAALAQMSLAIDRKLHLPDVRMATSDGDMHRAFDDTMGGNRYVFYDHFGTVEAAALLPKIRFMVQALDVEYIILDHVSIMVSGIATEGDERKRIDELMTRLRSQVEELCFGLHLVTHLRKAAGKPYEEGGRVTLGDLRGSGAISQLSDLVIAAERNTQAEDDAERNRVTLRCLKNRFSGDTGVVGDLVWEKETGRLRETDETEREAFARGDATGDF